jgi:hypothetical protein
VEVDPGQVAEYVQGVDDPYLIISDGFGDTELARELKGADFNVQFPAVRGLTIVRKGLAEGTQVDPVVLSSSTAFEVKTPTENPRPENGGKSGAMPLVVQATRRVTATDGKRNDETRMVVFGGSQVIVDAFWGFEPNRNMVMNAFAWATSQVQKITIRPPDRDISTVDLDAPRLAKIRFVSMDLVPLGLLGLGLAVWLNRRSK